MIKKETNVDAFSNIGLVHLCAKKFISKADYEDVFQAGCLGLMKAIDRFDNSLGYKFSTYAVPMIIGEIKSFLEKNSELKIPRELKKLSSLIKKVQKDFEDKNNRAPKISELSEILNVPSSEISEALLTEKEILRSDETENEEILFKSESYENKITEKLTLESILKNLKEEEKRLLDLRFKKNLSQTECAKIFGVSQMQISRRERKILLYIRGAFCDD